MIDIKESEFLKKYKALCQEYGYFIGACGCCDSPWVEKADQQHSLEDHFEHIVP